MIDFGGKLREARERRGIPLRQIAARTKISVVALEALERNDISKLPGGIFSRAFVRSYATEVGLDPEDVLRDFLEREQAEPPAVAVKVPIPESDLAFERRRRLAAYVFAAAVLCMLVAGAAVLYVVVKNRPAWLEDMGRAAQSGSTSSTFVASPAAPPVSAMEPAPSAAPAAYGAIPAAASDAPAPMRLELHPTADVWVSVVADGRAALTRTMKAGERETLEITDHAVLSVDDAGAFAFTVDGRTGRSLGRDGQSVTVRLTHDTVDDFVH